MSNPSLISQLAELQRKTIAAERAAIVRYLRRYLAPGQLADVIAAIERGAHLWDGELFKEPSTDANDNHPTTRGDHRPPSADDHRRARSPQ